MPLIYKGFEKYFVLAIALLLATTISFAKSNSDWNITQQTWQTNTKDLSIDVLNEQSHNEAVVLFNTIFSTEPNNKTEIIKKTKISEREFLHEKKKADFLKRLLISLAWLKYTTHKNGVDLKDWDFQISSALTRGGRILIECKEISAKEFLKFLTTGDVSFEKNDPDPIYHRRSFASHGISKQKGQPIEKSLKGFGGISQNILNSVSGYHEYINIAFGGLGSVQIDGFLVGLSGISIDPATKKQIKKRQHGHIYINLNTKLDSILIGIEASAPGTKNMFGNKHGASGAFRKSGGDPSVIGGYKWPVIREELDLEVPHEYGGKRLTITPELFETIKDVCNRWLKKDIDDQKKFFQHFLKSSGIEARQLLGLN